MPYCFEVRFRTPRHVADKIEEVFNDAPFKRPLQLYRPEGMNTRDGWLAVKSSGYAERREAEDSGARLQEGLLIVAAKQKIGVELYLGGTVYVWHQDSQLEVRDSGLPLLTSLEIDELKEMLGAAVESGASLTPNQRVAAELLNDSFFFFRMSPEARFLLRISAVEALCPQAEQTEAFKTTVHSVIASIPKDAPSSDQDRIKQALKKLAARQSARGAYMSKIRQLIGDDKAKKFDALYGRRSAFLHDGSGRGTLGEAADAALEIGLELLLADIAQSPPATAGGGMEAVTITDKDGAAFMLTLTVRPSGYSTRGQFFDGLIDGELIVHRSATPLLDACRVLKERGADPATRIIMRYDGQGYKALQSTVGAAAKLTVTDKDGAPIFRPWEAYSCRRVEAKTGGNAVEPYQTPAADQNALLQPTPAPLIVHLRGRTGLACDATSILAAGL